VKPVGDLSPMGLLWAFMAASPAYAFFGGAAELLGGVLLVFRRTALLGALVTAAVMTQVVMLNLCYDVCVKLLSSHLLAMAIFLALPDLKRLWDFFVVGRATGPAPSLPQFKRRWLNWSIAAATIGLFGLLTVRVFIDEYSICELCGQFGPRPRLQAVWDVVEFQCDGRVIPPLRTDATCWKQVVIQNEPGYGLMMDFESMTGMAGGWFLDIVEESRRMSLADLTTGKPAATLTYEEPAAETLVLSGVINGKKLHVTLRRAPADRFLLVNRGFHWIN
jgi:hypothetical protein